jgi:hypothetical protein
MCSAQKEIMADLSSMLVFALVFSIFLYSFYNKIVILIRKKRMSLWIVKIQAGECPFCQTKSLKNVAKKDFYVKFSCLNCKKDIQIHLRH